MDFTQEEWDNCIKVLKVLAKNPDAGFDTMVLKGLVTKIHKQAKKQIKAQNQQIDQERIISSNNLNFEKAKKIMKSQDVVKQYDNLLAQKSILYKNYNSNEKDESVEIEDLEYIKFKKCYICKQPYKKIHFFYHAICQKCGDFCFSKRNPIADLKDRIAIVTGGRIKIGYLTALQLLRSGVKVWVTTRFVNDCAERFSKEIDFDIWSNNLKIIPLDLRNIASVQEFITFFKNEEPYLDFLINNAAQTVKKPIDFYKHLFDFESINKNELPEKLQTVLPWNQEFHFLNIPEKTNLLPSEINELFPIGEFDKDNQQIDKRSINSWKLKMEEVSIVEMLESQLINVTSPFMLNSQLKEHLLKSPFSRKFIINVSAMEGQFNRASKTSFHPHTNMAKAALNMMTRTSAIDFASQNIFMNSVDTGWITQENPFQIKERLYQEDGFVPPLDEIDGMARILDPIYSGILNEEIPLFGHFLKDFKPYFW